MKHFAATLLGLFLTAITLFPAVAEERIRSYDTVIQVQEDGITFEKWLPMNPVRSSDGN